MIALIELAILIAIPVLLVVAMMRQRVAPGADRVLVVCGRPDALGHGYSVLSEPTRLVPLVERAEIFDRGALALQLRRRVLSQERTPIEIAVRARVRFIDSADALHHSLELLSGRSRDQIRELAEDAVAGALGMVAAICVAEDLLTAPNVVGLVRTQANDDLEALGLEVDALDLVPERAAHVRRGDG
jgi:hypothetical protein